MTLLVALLLATQAADKQAEEAAVAAVTACEAVFTKSKDTNARTDAINTMVQTKHERVLAKLLVYLSDADKGVKLAAISGTMTFEGAAPELKRLAAKNLARSIEAGANLKDIDFRIAATNGLGKLNEESTVTTMKVLLDDKNVRVAAAAVNACKEMKQKPLLEALMVTQRESEKTMRANATAPIKGRKPTSARKDPDAPPDPEDLKIERAAYLASIIPAAVQALTGQELKTGSDMESWWAKNRTSFNFPK
jgi:HEAT repeat protein